MSTSGTEPYVEFKPGDLIAADSMNEMQCLIRDDIGDQTQQAVDNINTVPNAENADKLDNQTLAEIQKAILDQALSQIAQHSGYQRLYKVLRVGEKNMIEHGLKNNPLVDIYQLDYFLVVSTEEGFVELTWVNFYLYHSSEAVIRYRPEGTNDSPVTIEIEPSRGQAHRIPFKDMLARYDVAYTDNSSVGEIENEFWKALFADPNDDFSDQQYTHSPWFDRCCREERTVKSLKQKGYWDDLYVKVMPRKTVNYPHGTVTDAGYAALPAEQWVAPPDIKVTHYDWNRVGIELLEGLKRAPLDPTQTFVGEIMEANATAAELIRSSLPDDRNMLKVMVLLRA